MQDVIIMTAIIDDNRANRAFICLLAVLLWVTLNALNSPLRSRLMMKNDKLMTMKKTGLQYALRTSKTGTGATFSSSPTPTPPTVYLNPPNPNKD